MNVNGQGISTRKKLLAVGEAFVAMLWPTLGLKWRTSFVSSGYSTEGTSLSALQYPTAGQGF